LAEARSATPEADNAVAAAKANFDLARATLRRMEDLAAKKSISDQEFDEASARLKAAAANHEMTRARRAQLDSKIAQAEQEVQAAGIMREYSRIAAPFSGVVTARSVEPGNLATPGAPLLIIEQDGVYRLEASVEESKIPHLRIGQTVEVTIDAIARTASARISEIVPYVDPASRTYTLKLDLPPLDQLRSGLFGRAAFPIGTRKAMLIPAPALIQRGQLQSVFVVEDGVAHTRLVTTGARLDRGIELLSGLNPGDAVVSPVPPGLQDGAAVEVRQ
jgi:RND family efflux transporter MFP subunit